MSTCVNELERCWMNVEMHSKKFVTMPYLFLLVKMYYGIHSCRILHLIWTP